MTERKEKGKEEGREREGKNGGRDGQGGREGKKEDREEGREEREREGSNGGEGLPRLTSPSPADDPTLPGRTERSLETPKEPKGTQIPPLKSPNMGDPQQLTQAAPS